MERAFNRVTHWRGVATRSDKSAQDYPGALHLVSIPLRASDPADPTGTT